MFDEKNGPICKSQRISKSIIDRVAKFQRNVKKMQKIPVHQVRIGIILRSIFVFLKGEFMKDTF